MNSSSPAFQRLTDSNCSRRTFLATAAAGALAGSSLRAAETRTLGTAAFPSRPAKHVIFVFLIGGPSQIDTWDPKPHAASNIRNFDPACQTSIPGVLISENLPLMAQRMHQVSLVRTLHHEGPATHAAGQQQLMTGHCFYHNEAAPYWGSVISSLAPRQSDLPANVILGDPLVHEHSTAESGQGRAWLPAEHDPVFLGGTSQLHHDRNCSRTLDTNQESWSTRVRYGFHTLGERCLQARRLVEAGTRVVTVNQFSTVLDETTWDMHANGGRLNTTSTDYRNTLCPQLDQALSGLLDDLSERGLLSETVVAVCGEMGRSPQINRYGGRDHHTGCWSGLLAGGPIHPGRVIGESDPTADVPAARPVSPAEFCATIYQSRGISSANTPISGRYGRAIPALKSAPIWELF